MKSTPSGRLVFCKKSSVEESVYIDEAGISGACDRVTLVYLGTKSLRRFWLVQGGIPSGYIRIVFMLVHEARPETYQRVGLLLVDIRSPIPLKFLGGPEELFKNVLTSTEKADSLSWNRRALRLV